MTMSRLSQVKGTYDEGRKDQFSEMMQQLSTLEAKYKGVRGELLAKVRAELEKLKPSPTTLSVVAPPAEVRAVASVSPVTSGAPLPSCRVCGRSMKLNGTDGTLVCQNGHTRLV
jgi:hypothetical protein